MASSGKIYIGTSGWMYKSWAKSFYPEDWPARRHLEFYCSKFPTVEINATFYRLPREKTFENWQEQSCPGFLYAVKGSQAVTHFKRLKPGAKSFRLLLKRATRLGSGLGPFLWQLPPTDAFGHVDSKVFPTMVTPVSVRLESGILSLVDLRSDG